MLTIKENSSLIKDFAHTIGNFMVWWGIWIMKIWQILFGLQMGQWKIGNLANQNLSQ